MNIGIGLVNLWIVVAFIIVYACVLMIIGDRIRHVKIENPEDHHGPKALIAHTLPLLAILVVSLLTPIVTGALFWIGSAMLFVAGLIYGCAIAAFVRAKKGLTLIGVYRFSRNPMYIAWILTFVGFTFMAWQAFAIMGIVSACIAVANAISVHWLVKREERFLRNKYGVEYDAYLKRTPRYLGISK